MKLIVLFVAFSPKNFQKSVFCPFLPHKSRPSSPHSTQAQMLQIIKTNLDGFKRWLVAAVLLHEDVLRAGQLNVLEDSAPVNCAPAHGSEWIRTMGRGIFLMMDGDALRHVLDVQH